jgi:toxin HigB-1
LPRNPDGFDLVFTDRYKKLERRFLKKHADLARTYVKTLELLAINPEHPSLRLHALSGRLSGTYSVSINLSYRITLQFVVTAHAILLVNVGDHDFVR